MVNLLFSIISHPSGNESALSAFLFSTKTFEESFKMEVSRDRIWVENVDESHINNLTSLISHYFYIRSMEIYTPSGECKKLEISDVKKMIDSKYPLNDYNVTLEKLYSTIVWAETTKHAPDKTIKNFLYGNIRTLSIEYTPKNLNSICINAGDVVEVMYGFNPSGETRGYHVPSIVCTVKEDMMFVIPLIRADYAKKLSNDDFLLPVMPGDIMYFIDKFSSDSVAHISRGRFVRVERINTMVGKASSSFMEQLLAELPKAFDFRK